MKQHANKTCDDWGEDISAYLDGELTMRQVAVVEEHLDSCNCCRELANCLGSVNHFVVAQVDALDTFQTIACSRSAKISPEKEQADSYAVLNSAPSAALNTKHKTGSNAAQKTAGRKTAWRLVPALVAGTVVASLFMLPSDSDPASTLTADEIARPIVELELIDRQRQRDQLLMIKTLEFDLRSLKIELSQMTHADESVKSELLTEQIDALIEKTNQIESQNLSYQYGNEVGYEPQD